MPGTLAKASDYRTIHRIADRLSPQMRRAFLDAVKELKRRIDPTRLQELLARGDQGELGAFWRAFEQEVGPALRSPMRDAILQSGERTGSAFGLRFDITNPRAVQAIDRQTATLIHDLTQESQAAIREVLREGFNEGVTVPDMARRIRGSIGLNARLSRAVERYRAGQIEAGVEGELADTRADRYARRLLNYRASNIARTETIRAASLGQQAAWETARAEGFIGEASRVWIVTPDDRLCENICEPMDGQVRGMNEPFTTGEGFHVMTPPAHPSCRCAVGLQFGEAA